MKNIWTEFISIHIPAKEDFAATGGVPRQHFYHISHPFVLKPQCGGNATLPLLACGTFRNEYCTVWSPGPHFHILYQHPGCVTPNEVCSICLELEKVEIGTCSECQAGKIMSIEEQRFYYNQQIERRECSLKNDRRSKDVKSVAKI